MGRWLILNLFVFLVLYFGTHKTYGGSDGYFSAISNAPHCYNKIKMLIFVLKQFRSLWLYQLLDPNKERERGVKKHPIESMTLTTDDNGMGSTPYRA